MTPSIPPWNVYRFDSVRQLHRTDDILRLRVVVILGPAEDIKCYSYFLLFTYVITFCINYVFGYYISNISNDGSLR